MSSCSFCYCFKILNVLSLNIIYRTVRLTGKRDKSVVTLPDSRNFTLPNFRLKKLKKKKRRETGKYIYV
jgi:hypothetical protein